jgi:tripartite-type tricarboxylate transporter receptor subunit TctC
VIFNPSGLIAPLVKSGKLKALATLGPKRSPHLPDVPSFKELGYDLDFLGWTGMFAPTGTPRDVVMRVNGEMNKLIADPGFVAKYLTPQSMDPRGGSPEDFAAFLRVDRETNGRLAKLAGVKPE